MTAAPPLVSVVIAVYNGERFVGRAIESVRRQSHPAIQLIVVDDGSTDATSRVVAGLGVDHLVTLPENRGVSTARNIGTAFARGSLLTYLDADDVMLPDKLARQILRLASPPHCDCVIGHQRVIVDDDQVPRPRWLTEEMLHREDTKLPISALMRMPSLLLSGGFDPTFATSEEMDLLFRFNRAGGVVVEFPVVGVERHIHGTNASYDHPGMARDLLRSMAPLARRRPPPLVSVVIPVREHARYVPEALESVAAQEGIDPDQVEVIVIDDGSTDDSAAVARSVAPQAQVVRQPQLGIGAARNHGLLLSRGRHVAFLDSDDAWLPGKLAAQLSMLDADPSLDAVFGGVEEFVSPDVDPARAATWRPRRVERAKVPGSLLLRREAMARVGLFATDPGQPESAEWYARAVDAGLVVADLGQVVLRRRLHGANHSRRTQQAERVYPRLLKEILDRRRAAAP